jgi:hypothetical protein
MKWRLFLLCCAVCLIFSCAGVAVYQRLDSAGEMRSCTGKKVELTGRISDTPWQHLIGNPFGYGESYYFDVKDFQIVIYARTPITCPGEITVRGKVIKVQGPPKREGGKVDETYVEYHLIVDEWSCEEN